MNIICDIQKEYDTALFLGAKLIKEGKLVAFPTETVYGLGADAMNEDAVKSIFTAKGRPSDNPLIVHIGKKEQLSELAASISPMAKKLTDAFWPGPFTAVLKKRDCVPHCVSGGLDTVAVRMPETKFARDLILKSGCFIAAPSANISGKPSPTLASHVIDDFGDVLPLIADGGPCGVGVESTVCDLTGDIPVILRPGGITAEMIKEIAGDVLVHEAVLGGLKDGPAPSPGMKYKHYSPDADVVIYCGDKKDVAQNINLLYDTIKSGCVIMCMSEHAYLYEGKNIINLGHDSKEAAKHVFAVLRDSDKKGIKKIIFHGIGTDGEGLAVMNRMIRAAGHNVTYITGEVKID